MYSLQLGCLSITKVKIKEEKNFATKEKINRNTPLIKKTCTVTRWYTEVEIPVYKKKKILVEDNKNDVFGTPSLEDTVGTVLATRGILSLGCWTFLDVLIILQQ